MYCNLLNIGTAQKVLDSELKVSLSQWYNGQERVEGGITTKERGSIRSLTHMGVMRRGGNVTKFL